VVVTRRALLGAGAVALLAGCGPPEEVEPAVDDVLTDQLRAERAVVAAYAGLSDRGIDDLRERARERVRRLEAALPAGAATPAAAPPEQPGLEYALEAERHALRTHVQAVGLVQDRATRALNADLVADCARSESALLIALERPPFPSAFPGQPV
jgi:hypothetical protein